MDCTLNTEQHKYEICHMMHTVNKAITDEYIVIWNHSIVLCSRPSSSGIDKTAILSVCCNYSYIF